ncbi:hypothetical protein BC477_08850 [Clavibacter michiganensis subsp. michiganensis]|uniref:Uncharacterized protein n=1 Tax=Clavibacter michiganensis subsp. michiganensis TaxID=33013 RepID=A0A251XMW2_CLAMM|nr:hypothetical protein BC477_08850 [Clavibacter michiganensis subsp. michiganensis]OUE04832.1 hypothetical protein CMMCAS07_07775 [Clavibacter michiganensis subsp. michiganensis]
MSDQATCPFCALLRDEPPVAPLPQDVVAERDRAVAVIARAGGRATAGTPW